MCSSLRKALGEEPGHAQYIETIPWRGYRLVAELKRSTGATGDRGDSLAVLPFVSETLDPSAEYLCRWNH